MFGRSILFNHLLCSPWRLQCCRIWLEMETCLWEGKESSLLDEADPDWPKEAAQLFSMPGCPPSSCRVQHPPGTWAVCCQKLHFSAGKVPAQQWAGSSDYTALGFFLGDCQGISLYGPVDLIPIVQNHCPGTGCKPCSSGTSLFWCSWQSLGAVLALEFSLQSSLI